MEYNEALLSKCSASDLESAIVKSFGEVGVLTRNDIADQQAKRILEIAERKHLKYTHEPATQSLRLIMPTWAHSGCLDWLQRWATKMTTSEDLHEEDISAAGGGQLGGFTGQFHNMFSKTSDGALFVTPRDFPTVVLEVGYFETYDQLEHDARILLEGSSGEIGHAILIKIHPLRPGETRVRSAFVQLYHYDTSTGKAARKGSQKTLFPIPVSHASQKLTFTWDDVLMDQRAFMAIQAPSPPGLSLDSLRDTVQSHATRDIRLQLRQTTLSGPQ